MPKEIVVLWFIKIGDFFRQIFKGIAPGAEMLKIDKPGNFFRQYGKTVVTQVEGCEQAKIPD